MGHVAAQALGPQIYNLAFICYEGKSGLVIGKPFALELPPAGLTPRLFWAGLGRC
jgi:hypothetical protein